MKTLEKKQKCTTNDNNQNVSSLRGVDAVNDVAIRCRCSCHPKQSEESRRCFLSVISSERSDERSAVCSVNVNKTPLSRAAFTLVELVITIAIVIILSVISVPIYRGYVDKAKYAEGYALIGQILSAQKAYYSEYGNFLLHEHSGWTSYDTKINIDARGNKYFTYFHVGASSSFGSSKYYFHSEIIKPLELQSNNKTGILLQYNITLGSKLGDYPECGINVDW